MENSFNRIATVVENKTWSIINAELTLFKSGDLHDGFHIMTKQVREGLDCKLEGTFACLVLDLVRRHKGEDEPVNNKHLLNLLESSRTATKAPTDVPVAQPIEPYKNYSYILRNDDEYLTKIV